MQANPRTPSLIATCKSLYAGRVSNQVLLYQDRNKQRNTDLYPMTTVSNSNANKYSKDGETTPAVSEELHHLKEVYSTALGGYQQWSNQVDLGPPKSRDRNIRVRPVL